jgi:hypothetical protein
MEREIMGDLIKAPWDQKPGIEKKLDIDESEELFADFDESSVKFDLDNPEQDMIFDYSAARKNAHFCVFASKKILNMIAGNLLYTRDPLIADACVKLVKVISENNRDLIKIHKDFKATKQIGKPKDAPEKEDSDEDREKTVKASVSEVVAAAKAAEGKNESE